MVSDADVVNVALRMIGSERITGLETDDPAATEANDIYSDLVEDLLRQHFWNFATKRVKLPRMTTDPTYEFDHAYSLPSDWLRTISVHPDENGYGRMLYKEELVDNKNAIVTSADDVYLRYVARITDPNKWSADFRRAVSSALARDLAIIRASSNTLQKKMDAQATRDLSRARSTDAMGSSPERRPRGSWVARRGGYRPRPGTIDDA